MAFPRGGTEYRQETTAGSRFTAQILRTSKQGIKPLYQSQGCMHKRNRHLVDNSSVCVCYLNKENGGTAYTVDYAGKKGLEIINLVKSCSPFSAAKWQRQKCRQSRGQSGVLDRSGLGLSQKNDRKP